MRFLIMIGLASVALASCGSDEKKATVGDTTFTSNDKDGTATISNDRGTLSATTGAEAANTKMPDFAPQYPGSTIESVLNTDTAGGKSQMINLNTGDAPAKVTEFYKGKLSAAGLKIGMDMTTAETGMVTGEGNGHSASVTASAEDGKTAVLVTITTK